MQNTLSSRSWRRVGPKSLGAVAALVVASVVLPVASPASAHSAAAAASSAGRLRVPLSRDVTRLLLAAGAGGGTNEAPSCVSSTTSTTGPGGGAPATGETCMERGGGPVSSTTAVLPQGAAAAAAAPGDLIVPADPSCLNHPQQIVFVSRTSGCYIESLHYWNSLVVDDAPVITGEIFMTVIEVFYSAGEPFVGDQITIGVSSAWGTGLTMELSFFPRSYFGCTLKNAEAPAAVPANVDHNAWAVYDSDETSPGAVARCTTSWILTFSDPTLEYPGADVGYAESAFRCDDALPDNADDPDNPDANGGGDGLDLPGCVIPDYLPTMRYLYGFAPDLWTHIANAQASGLPGAPGYIPLSRTTDQGMRRLNQGRACGDRPPDPDRQCDEYPFASTQQGLAFQVNWQDLRRSFDGCDYPLPAQTGPIGVSSCLVPIADQKYQAQVIRDFYHSNRVLNDDQFYVLLVP
jgi:hypothetical protein